MDKQPVICPWCGSEMSPAAYETVHEKFVGYYVCLECDCESPCVIGCKDYDNAIAQAYQRAISRPLQKPLTWEEIMNIKQDHLFKETKGGLVVPCSFQLSTLYGHIELLFPGEEDECVYGNVGYGQTWRCWDHYPSDEERSAAEWKK